jgi:hypothetical protein
VNWRIRNDWLKKPLINWQKHTKKKRRAKQELVTAKAKLDDLKIEDSVCSQALEEAKEMGERLMKKV